MISSQLPTGLAARPFSVMTARAAGVTKKRLRTSSLAAPFHGVRVEGTVCDVDARAAACAARMRPWQAIGGPTAVLLLGLPIPLALERDERVHVVSPKSRNAPSAAGVAARRIADGLLTTVQISGMPVTPPALTWALLARDLTEHQLVVVGDAIVSDASNYPGRRSRGPLASIDDLGAMVAAAKGITGVDRLRAALARIRPKVESPMETEMRLHIVDAGIDEPEVQVSFVDTRTGDRIGRTDLFHRAERVVEEYEADGHRSKEQFRRDITKYERLQEVGIMVVRATADDFWPSPAAWTARLARILASRRP